MADDDAELSFEEALVHLEEVVVRLERGDLSLDDSIGAYERGVRLVHKAKARLDAMQRKLDQLLDDGTLHPIKTKADTEKGTP